MLIILVQEQTHTTHAVQQMDTQEVTALEQVAPVIHQAVTVLLDLVTVLQLAVTVLQKIHIATLAEETVILVVAQAGTVILIQPSFQIVMLDMETVIHRVETVMHREETADQQQVETVEASVTA
jgi:hypothetical protein